MEIKPYIYHGVGLNKNLPAISQFTVFKSVTNMQWGPYTLDVYIIGQSHFIQFNLGFSELCACVPFETRENVHSFSVENEYTYKLPSLIHDNIEIKVGGKVLSDISDLELEAKEIVIGHDFNNEGRTKLVFKNITKEKHATYQTLHTYPEYGMSLITSTELCYFNV